MKKSILVLGSIALLFAISGCTEKEIVYIKTPCAKQYVHSYEKQEFEPLTVDYEVIN